MASRNAGDYSRLISQPLNNGTALNSPGSSSNGLAPIFRLPDELLLDVFKRTRNSKLSALTLPEHLHWARLVGEDSWVELITPSHVCRQWRTVALGCPSLWSRIILTKPDIMEEMLSRASLSPLSIAIQDSSPVDHILASQAESKQLLAMDRLERLHLSLPTGSLQSLLNSVTAGAAFPYLRSLFIQDSDRWTDVTATSAHYPYTIPTHILSVPMPCLQHLYIAYCTIPWESIQHCRSLTSLRLDHVSKPSRTQFYSLLASNIDLETLYLKSALPQPSSEAIDPPKLYKLSFCKISMVTVSQCLDFQKHVSYTIDRAKVQLCASESDAIDITLTGALISACQESFYHPRSSCVLFEAYRGIPRIVVSPIPSSEYGDPLLHDEFFCSIDLTNYMTMLYDRRRFRWLELLFVPNIEKIIARAGADSVGEDEWLNFFHRHPGITTLRICDYSTEMMLTLLSKSHVDDITDELRSSPEERSQLLPCLPNLVTVELEGFAPGHASTSDEFTRLFELLRSCLSKRRSYGLQVRELKLCSCQSISLVAAKILENEVGRVMHMGESRFQEEYKDSDESGSESSTFDSEPEMEIDVLSGSETEGPSNA